MRPFNQSHGSPNRSNSSSPRSTGSPPRLDPLPSDSSGSSYNDPRKEFLSPGWRVPLDHTVGYSGHSPERDHQLHVLDQSLRKPKIGGYSGFIPQTKNICGTAIIRFEEPPLQASLEQRMSPSYRDSLKQSNSFKSPGGSPSTTTFRNFGKHLDIEERYAAAVELLRKEHNQTQEILLRMLQSKLSEKIHSYAQQTIRTRKLFEGFDKDRDGCLSENEFRDCLENENVQFDDVQILALFAYFDRNNTGFIEFSSFAENAMVFNPKGGTAVLPKMIIETLRA
jgi:Ca2+-binding EF-hand superfamily protein